MHGFSYPFLSCSYPNCCTMSAVQAVNTGTAVVGTYAQTLLKGWPQMKASIKPEGKIANGICLPCAQKVWGGGVVKDSMGPGDRLESQLKARSFTFSEAATSGPVEPGDFTELVMEGIKVHRWMPEVSWTFGFFGLSINSCPSSYNWSWYALDLCRRTLPLCAYTSLAPHGAQAARCL